MTSILTTYDLSIVQLEPDSSDTEPDSPPYHPFSWIISPQIPSDGSESTAAALAPSFPTATVVAQ